MGLRATIYARMKTSWNIGRLTLVSSASVFPNGSGRKSGIFFKPDGTRLYTSSDTSELAQYDLTTPWSIATITANYLNTSQTGSQQGITLKNDGTKLYLVNITSNLIQAFNLTTAWDVSVKTTAETTSIPANGRGIEFNLDGTVLFVATSSSVISYSLSTPWNVSTKTLIYTKDLSADSTTLQDLRISPDGRNFYLPRAPLGLIFQYKASTPWDISTLTLFTTSAPVAVGAILGFWFRNDGKKLYTVANTAGLALSEWNWK